MENPFLKKISEITEANLSDPEFGVEQLARKMNMSYSSLWRRVSKYTGKSANQFIREIRLTRAKEILEEEDVPISEAAYRTGFSSANYFSTCFQNFFGYPPGELKKPGGNNSQEIKAEDPKTKDKPSGKPILLKIKGIKSNWKILAGALLICLSASAAVLMRDWTGNRDKRIAILIPKNQGQDERTESFCGGLQEQMLNDLKGLTKVKELKELEGLVIRSRVTADLFSKPKQAIRKIGRRLKADYIFDSFVDREGDIFNVSAGLIKAKDDVFVMSKSYKRRDNFPFELQTELAHEIAWDIMNSLLGETNHNTSGTKELSTEAEKLCMQGNSYADRFNFRPDYAIESYLKAIDTDSLCAEAYIGLASVMNRIYFDIETRDDTILPTGKRAVDKAAGLNKNLSSVRIQRGLNCVLSGDSTGAAAALNGDLYKPIPADERLYDISKAWMRLGRWDKAENCLYRLTEVQAYKALTFLGLGEYFESVRDFKNAERNYRWAKSSNPAYGPSIFGLTHTLLKSGKPLAEIHEFIDSLGNTSFTGQDSLKIYYLKAMIELYEGNFEKSMKWLSGWNRVTASSPPYYFRPRFMLMAQVSGLMKEHDLERQYYDSARIFIEGRQEKAASVRDDPRVVSALGIVYQGLGLKAKADSCAKKTIELLTDKPDSWLGPYAMEDVAFIYFKAGRYKEACKILRQLLTDPGPLTLSLLELDPRWAALRKMPEYTELKVELGVAQIP